MVRVRGVEIGSERPKICVPIVEETQEDILEEAGRITYSSAELVEWRVDYYEDALQEKKVIETAGLLQSILGKKIPLLFTFRTKKEGGEKEILWEQYASLLKNTAKSGYVDLIDLEMFRGYDERVRQKREWKVSDICNSKVLDLLEELNKRVVVIGSYHDFEKTPSKEEILRRLLFMDRMGADIPKLAAMPQEREDVLRLMEATSLADRLIVEKPIITMSMGVMGAATRVIGETFGSAISFGCMEKGSAPGQIEVEQLKEVLEILHHNHG